MIESASQEHRTAPAVVQDQNVANGGTPAPNGPHPDAPPITEVVGALEDLPTLAPVAMQVIRLADDEVASLNDLVDVISRDPGLTARLLRVANSATYGQIRQVTNLNRATSLLGSHTVKLLSLGFSLVASTRDAAADTGVIWQRSLVTGVLARHFSGLPGYQRLGDDAFVAGLLGNIGKLALAKCPRSAELVSNSGMWCQPETETALLGYTSDEVTARILESWGLPAMLVDAVRHRWNPTKTEDPGTSLAALLQVADAGAGLLLSEDDDSRTKAHNRMILAGAANLGATAGQLEELMTAARPEVDDMMDMFDLESVPDMSVADIIMQAQTRMAQLSQELAGQLLQQEERNQVLVEANRRLSDEAATDPLTGIANRRTFIAYLDKQTDGTTKASASTVLGLILIDIDNFKEINDTNGHTVGDAVLSEVAGRLSWATRRSDLVARLGGDEFAVVMPGIDPRELHPAAERFRLLFANEPICAEDMSVDVTVSIGVANTAVDVTPMAGDAEQLYAAADAALYESKNSGRNHVTVSPLP